MMETFRCEDKETLIAYIYGEADADLRRLVDLHLRSCAACANEVEALQGVRHGLQSWLPPEANLDFAIVPKSAQIIRPTRWAIPALPAWARVAAAALIIAGSAAIANVQVKYGQDGLTIRTGWMAIEPPPSTAPVMNRTSTARAEPTVAGTPADSETQWRQALAALEVEMRRELQAVRRASADNAEANRVVRTAAPTSVSNNDELMRRIQTMLDESEKRQQRELALRFTQFTRDFDIRRRADLARIDLNLGQLQGQTQRQMMNLMQRVSTPVP